MSKIIIMHELQYRTLSDLEAMHRRVSENLARSNAGSAERRNALASLENICRTLNARRAIKAPSL